jgi:hypothetical protein
VIELYDISQAPLGPQEETCWVPWHLESSSDWSKKVAGLFPATWTKVWHQNPGV